MSEQNYSLPKSRLFLEGTRLIRKDKKDKIVADLDVRRIQSVDTVSELDRAGVPITAGMFGITFVLYRFLSDGLWRWLAVAVFGAASLLCLLAVRKRVIRITTLTERLEYRTLDLPDQVSSFVAMLNQRKQEASS